MYTYKYFEKPCFHGVLDTQHLDELDRKSLFNLFLRELRNVNHNLRQINHPFFNAPVSMNNLAFKMVKTTNPVFPSNLLILQVSSDEKVETHQELLIEDSIDFSDHVIYGNLAFRFYYMENSEVHLENGSYIDTDLNKIYFLNHQKTSPNLLSVPNFHELNCMLHYMPSLNSTLILMINSSDNFECDCKHVYEVDFPISQHSVIASDNFTTLAIDNTSNEKLCELHTEMGSDIEKQIMFNKERIKFQISDNNNSPGEVYTCLKQKLGGPSALSNYYMSLSMYEVRLHMGFYFDHDCDLPEFDWELALKPLTMGQLPIIVSTYSGASDIEKNIFHSVIDSNLL